MSRIDQRLVRYISTVFLATFKPIIVYLWNSLGHRMWFIVSIHHLITLSVYTYLYVSISVCLYVCMSVCLSVCLYVSLSVSMCL